MNAEKFVTGRKGTLRYMAEKPSDTVPVFAVNGGKRTVIIQQPKTGQNAK